MGYINIRTGKTKYKAKVNAPKPVSIDTPVTEGRKAEPIVGSGVAIITDKMKNIILSNKNPKNDTIKSTNKNYNKFINFQF